MRFLFQRYDRKDADAELTFLLRDEFTTPDDAPVTTPRTAEPGPGTLTIVDTNDIMSIAGGAMVLNGTSAANNGIISAQFARSAGLLFYLRVTDRTTITSSTRIGWSTNPLNNSDIYIGFDWQSTTTIRIKDGTGLVGLAVTVSTATDFACIMRGTGGFLFYKNTAGNWQLLWVYNTTSSAQYAKMWVSSSVVNYKTDSWRVAQLATPFTTDNGLATDAELGSVAQSTTFTHEADFLIEYTLGSASNNYQVEVFIRIQDATNYWELENYYGTGSGTSTLRLKEYVAGAGTTRAQTAATSLNGARVVVMAAGETITAYVDNVQVWSYTSAANFKTETDGKVNLVQADWSISNLITWPRTLSGAALAELEAYTA